MVQQKSLLVTLVMLVDNIPVSQEKKRGRPFVYPENLFLKALVIMILRRLHSVNELRQVLEQPTAEMKFLKTQFLIAGTYPSRRTWERRLAAIPEQLPAQIGCLGRHLVRLIQPWGEYGRAVAIDSTVLRSLGGVWHQKDRKQGKLPHHSIDTQAHWTKSGWHGWVYGWKLHVVSVVAGVWIPLAANLTSANEADNIAAPALLDELPQEALFILGDRHYNRPNIRDYCQTHHRILVTTQYGKYPHTDEGKEVRRIFHMLRHKSIENFNEHFKSIFEGHGQVPTKGLTRTKRFVLGSVFLYQLALLYRFQHDLDLNLGLKHFIKAA